ncbi:MAG: ROK family protein [Candidatus Theseobacter exili]|nr:ROK family protein [Candidatus Theseobacter exili]
MNEKYWIGFDLGGTKMLATVFNEKFTSIGQKRRKTKSHEGIEAGLKRMIQTINDALNNSGISADQLSGIGVGCPGPLDLDKGVILDLPNLGWENAPVKEVLESAFHCPVAIVNDVDAGVYGEYRMGAAKKAHCVVGVFPGTGIGGGCVYNGKLIRGKTGSCFEIGHIPVFKDGPLCGCGRRGCLEAIAGRLAISSAAAAAVFRGEAPYLLENAGTDLSNIKSGTLARSIAAGDKAIEQIIRHAASILGYSLSGIINLMSPDIVLLGGGLPEAMPKLYTEEVSNAIKNQVMPIYDGTYKIVLAKLGDDATVTGAATWVQESTTNKK